MFLIYLPFRLKRSHEGRFQRQLCRQFFQFVLPAFLNPSLASSVCSLRAQWQPRCRMLTPALVNKVKLIRLFEKKTSHSVHACAHNANTNTHRRSGMEWTVIEVCVPVLKPQMSQTRACDSELRAYRLLQ